MKIGFFIKELREEKGVTQQELADILKVQRQTISKWERGISEPNYGCLLELSKFFSISTNELIYGARETNDNRNKLNEIGVKLYSEKKKYQRLFLISIFTIIFLFITFLISYFLNTYNSLKVYTINIHNENICITDGVFVISPEKLFFDLGTIDTKIDIRKLELFYKNKEEKNIFIHSRASSDQSVASLNFTYFNQDGANINFKDLAQVLNNLYLEITYDNFKEIIKVELIESFRNDNLIFSEKKSAKPQNAESIELPHNEYLENKIKKVFRKNGDFYEYKINQKIFLYEDINRKVTYLDEKGGIYKDWSYNIIYDNYTYQEFTKEEVLTSWEYSEELICKIGNCDNYIDKIIYFQNEFQKILN